jgi:hypothetical protein
MIDKPKTGTTDAPTLSKKGVSEFTVTPDVQRIMGTKSDPNGFNPEVNRMPITDPSSRSYAARIVERAATKKTASTLKGKSPPLGHVESPSSEKMEAIAGLTTDGMARPSFIEEPPRPPEPQERVETPEPEKENQPPTIRGVGAAYPVNQALTQGKTDGPVTLKEGNKMAQQQVFSKETIQALEMANENIKKPDKAPEKTSEKAPEKPSVAQEAKRELDEAEQALGPAATLDYANIGDLRETLMSQSRRDAIEARLSTLDIGDMIMKRELTQTIPVIPGKLEVTLRTFSQRENLWVLKYIYDFPGSALYLQELLNTCRLVCGLVAVNGAYLPDHRKDSGQNTEVIIKEDFEKKFFHVSSFPVQLVADLSVQSIWFQDRVDQLFTVDSLKNG